MYYYLYRIRGGQVVTTSVDPITGHDPTYHGVFESETSIDLDPPKVCLGDPLEIRVATQTEIDYFPTAVTIDERKQQRSEAITFMTEGKKRPEKRILYAVLIVMRSQLNVIRSEIGLAPISLSTMKTAISNIVNSS